MNKKQIIVILAVLVFSVETAFTQNETDFEVSVENGKVTITGYKGSLVNLVIPARIHDMPVAVIGKEAFFALHKITGVTIPDTVIEIGELAFAANRLENVTIPSSVKTIGRGAFRENRLKNVTVPDSVTSLGEEVFASQIENSRSEGLEAFFIMTYKNEVTITKYNGNGGNVIIPEKINNMPVVAIAASAFAYTYVSEITIPNTVRTIGFEAFVGNYLRNIVIPNSVTSIGHGAFSNNELRNVVVPDSIIFMGSGVFSINQLNQTIRDDLARRFGGNVIGR